RKPNVGVQHGLQHLERVAAACEMMRDDQRDKANRARARRADSVSENSFEYQRDNDRAPADENRGGIKVGDRGTLLQIHPRNETKRVNGKLEQQQIKCRTVEHPTPSEPRKTSQKKA